MRNPRIESRSIFHRMRIRLLRKLTGRPTILFERPSGIGDIICTFPALLAFRKLHPEAIFVYGAEHGFKSIVEMGHVADYVVDADWYEAKPKSYQQDYSSAYRLYLEDERPRGRPHAHLVDDFCQTMGVTPMSRQPQLFVPDKILNTVNKIILPLRKKDRLLIGIHVGPSWPVREWPAAGWTILLQLLHKNFDCTILQLGSDAHTGKGFLAADRIAGSMDWVNRHDLPQTVACLKLVDFFIGIDSGLLHAAGAVGTPVVGLFGPINPKLRLPPESPSFAVTSSVPCLGCHHRLPILHWRENCPFDIACMKQISADAVLTSCNLLLSARGCPIHL